MDSLAVFVVAIVISIASYVITIIKTLSWIMGKVDKRIDEKLMLSVTIDKRIDDRIVMHPLDKRIDDRIEIHPIMKEYKNINWRLEQLEKSSGSIINILQSIERKING